MPTEIKVYMTLSTTCSSHFRLTFKLMQPIIRPIEVNPYQTNAVTMTISLERWSQQTFYDTFNMPYSLIKQDQAPSGRSFYTFCPDQVDAKPIITRTV